MDLIWKKKGVQHETNRVLSHTWKVVLGIICTYCSAAQYTACPASSRKKDNIERFAIAENRYLRVILFLPFLVVTVSAPPRFPRDTPANMSRGHGHIFSTSIWHSFLSSSSPSRFSFGVSECLSTARLHVGPVRRCTLFNACALAILLGLWTGPLARRRDGSLGPGTNALVDVGPSALVYSRYCSPLRSVCVAVLSSTRRHDLANWRALLSQNRSLARLWDGRIAYDVPLRTLWCFLQRAFIEISCAWCVQTWFACKCDAVWCNGRTRNAWCNWSVAGTIGQRIVAMHSGPELRDGMLRGMFDQSLSSRFSRLHFPTVSPLRAVGVNALPSFSIRCALAGRRRAIPLLFFQSFFVLFFSTFFVSLFVNTLVSSALVPVVCPVHLGSSVCALALAIQRSSCGNEGCLGVPGVGPIAVPFPQWDKSTPPLFSLHSVQKKKRKHRRRVIMPKKRNWPQRRRHSSRSPRRLRRPTHEQHSSAVKLLVENRRACLTTHSVKGDGTAQSQWQWQWSLVQSALCTWAPEWLLPWLAQFASCRDNLSRMFLLRVKVMDVRRKDMPCKRKHTCGHLWNATFATIVSNVLHVTALYFTRTHNQSIKLSRNQSFRHSINQSIRQSLNQSISRSHNVSICQSVNQWIRQYISQSISQSLCQWTSQPVNQHSRQTVDQASRQSVHQSISQATDQASRTPHQPKDNKNHTQQKWDQPQNRVFVSTSTDSARYHKQKEKTCKNTSDKARLLLSVLQEGKRALTCGHRMTALTNISNRGLCASHVCWSVVYVVSVM